MKRLLLIAALALAGCTEKVYVDKSTGKEIPPPAPQIPIISEKPVSSFDLAPHEVIVRDTGCHYYIYDRSMTPKYIGPDSVQCDALPWHVNK